MSLPQRTILNLMKDSAICTVWAKAEVDEWGIETYGEPFLIKAEFRAESGIAVTKDNKQVAYTCLYFTEKTPETAVIESGFRIISGDKLLDGDPVAAFEVLSVGENSAILPNDTPDLRIVC